MAFVVLRTAVTAEELRRFLASQLARFKLPREITFLSELPRNALGKVQHFRLRQGGTAVMAGEAPRSDDRAR